MGVTICTCNQPVSVPSSTVSIEEEKPTDKLKKISTEKTSFSNSPSPQSKTVSSNSVKKFNPTEEIVHLRKKKRTKSSKSLGSQRNSAFLTRTVIYVAVLGPPLCGKRTLILNGSKQTAFPKNEFKKKYNFGNGKIYDIEIMVYPYQNKGNYGMNNKTDFFVVMYDIGNEESLNKAKEIIEMPEIHDNIITFKENSKEKKNLFLIANKTDLYDKESYCKAEHFCDKHNYRYYETSTKNQKLLDTIVKEMVISFDDQMFYS